MTRMLLSVTLIGLFGCVDSARMVRSTVAPHGSVRSAAASREAMLERVQDEHTRTIDLPGFGACPYAAADIPVFAPVEDADIPGVALHGTRASNEDLGDQSLDNQVLLLHLDAATHEVFECLNVAACYDSDATLPGEIEFTFEIEPSGRVRGVDVMPSEQFDRWGVVPCARRAIYEAEFPAYDGADMLVSYRLDLD